ncbi:nucleotidyltransferase domain-containing protein [Arthrobacter sp. JSM 101049]|uniref:nucleotidyltransferase domain-containing protein n=1 Tax=Arthrobacter sp. JSM 101049 TaxID=929097 RepID=UPI003567A9BE
MRLQNPIAALTPTVDAAVLLVLARADTSFTAPAVHRLSPEKYSESGVRNALARLVKQGIALGDITGQTRSYRLNREHLLAASITEMAHAKDMLLGQVWDEIRAWPVEPLDVRLFGSAARNEMHDDSDVDLLFIFHDGYDEDAATSRLTDLSLKVSAWTGNDARPLVYRESEVEQDPLFLNIIAEGIPVLPACRWLEARLGAHTATP